MGSFINVAFGKWCFTTVSHPLSLSFQAPMILFLTTISTAILMSVPGSCSADVQYGGDRIGYEFPAEVEALMSSMSSFAVGDRCNYLEGNNSLKFVEARALGSPPKVLDHHGGFREVFNVMGEGAVGDGRVDDAKAFHRTWKRVCNKTSAIMYVPAGWKFALRPTTFSGPCASNLLLQVEGTIVAMEGPGSGTELKSEWLEFKDLYNFSMVGNGKINGRGKRWWGQACRATSNTCQPNAEVPPNALVFENCTNVRVSRLKIQDSPKFHLSFLNCSGVRATGLHLSAPRDSPNTDGIHLKDSQNVFILNCRIRTGDDCISIQSGSSRVMVQDIQCGPGHGISVGSLGKGKTIATVWGVLVNRVNFTHTTNGFRIKTWQGGSGRAHGMKFMNARMNHVEKPVVINQFYCDAATPCANQTSAVAVSEVIFTNITGTSATTTGVDIECSDSVPCRNVVLQNINLRLDSGPKIPAYSTCRNVYGFTSHLNNSMSCALLSHPIADYNYQP